MLSIEMVLSDLDSAVMDPKELLILWYNWNSTTVTMYNIHPRDYYLL